MGNDFMMGKMFFEVPEKLKVKFKLKCIMNDKSMANVLQNFMRRYVK